MKTLQLDRKLIFRISFLLLYIQFTILIFLIGVVRIANCPLSLQLVVMQETSMKIFISLTSF